MSSLVSIIIPVYNVDKYLDECIESVINQTYKNLEILIIDDWSTDKSGEICDNWEKKDNRIRIFHTENKGVSHARNVGLDNIHWDFCAFIDPDDVVSPYNIEIYYSAIKNSNNMYDVVRWKYKKWYIYKWLYQWTTLHAYKQGILVDDDKKDALHREWWVWNTLIKSELVKNIRFNEDLIVNEDLLFYAKFIEKAEGIYVIDFPLYFYRKRNDSLCHYETKKRIDNRVFVGRELANFYQNLWKKDLYEYFKIYEQIQRIGYWQCFHEWNFHELKNIVSNILHNPYVTFWNKMSAIFKLYFPSWFLIIFWIKVVK